VQRYGTEGVHVVGEALIDPISPASALDRLLRNVPSAVLAMATHGRSGMQRIVFGSVAGNIVDVSPMPAVIFRLTH
jgi:nucleotide-binding universal stress UspA family protein